MNWFKEAQFGMMIHWGLYTLLQGEYQGKSAGNYAEWIQSYFQIPNKEYEKLAEAFNPIYFDAKEIVGYAKKWGMKYLVVTTKHHDGFAMYDSKVDDYNIVQRTPFKRDIIKELADACKEEGLKFGIYYSQDLDWHERNGGGYLSNHIETAGSTWDNSWDFIGEKDFNQYFEDKMMPQIKEIMTNYGEISVAWFDVPMTLTEAQSQMIFETVKKLQPNCLINSRLGNGLYDYVSMGDNEVPETLDVDLNDIDYNAVDGLKPSPNGLYETAATMNRSWGFAYRDHDWKSAKEIYKLKTHLKSLGMNYLLNIGLDPLGRIPGVCIDILDELKNLENN